jgi:multiple sugar transport system permease protein
VRALSKSASGAVAGAVLRYVVLVAVSIIFVFPVYWVFLKAINGPIAIFQYPPDVFPVRLSLANFKAAFGTFHLARNFLNTMKIMGFALVGASLSSAVVGYGFARMRFRARNLLFMVVIASIFIPWDVKVIPQFIEFSALGWINTYLPLLVPLFFGYPFYIFIFRQFITQIPYELDESAIIDGCSRVGIFVRIILPNLTPPFVTVLVYEFVRSWNDFLDPLIYLNKSTTYTLSLGIYHIISPWFMDWGALLAGSAFSVLFPVTLFFILQKYLFGGLVLSGIKA